MDTIGNIIDKLFTANMKMMYNLDKPERIKNLKEQHTALSKEIDDGVAKIFATKDIDPMDVIRPQHKTY